MKYAISREHPAVRFNYMIQDNYKKLIEFSSWYTDPRKTGIAGQFTVAIWKVKNIKQTK